MARPKKVNLEGKTSCLVINFCEWKHRCCHFCKKETCILKCKDDIATCKYLTETIEEKPKETKKSEPIKAKPLIMYGKTAIETKKEPKKAVAKRGPKKKEVVSEETKPIEPIKRGRGRPPKNKN